LTREGHQSRVEPRSLQLPVVNHQHLLTVAGPCKFVLLDYSSIYPLKFPMDFQRTWQFMCSGQTQQATSLPQVQLLIHALYLQVLSFCQFRTTQTKQFTFPTVLRFLFSARNVLHLFVRPATLHSVAFQSLSLRTHRKLPREVLCPVAALDSSMAKWFFGENWVSELNPKYSLVQVLRS
jgi:hypothetical protein